MARSEATGIQNKLEGITHYTSYFALETWDAQNGSTVLSTELESRLFLNDYGAYYTTQDSDEGGVAVFYSGVVPVGETEKINLENSWPLKK